MNDFSYSVAIRTIGTAGTKYETLLKSIEKQTIKPEKIIIVLPDGYKNPDVVLGNEIFLHSPKGMITQRLYALDFIGSDYVLFSDDDMEFESDFVEKLMNPLVNEGYDCSSGPLLELFPPNTLKYKFASILGGACVMLRGKDHMYTRVLATGGWSYNYDIKPNKIYDAESLSWGCFLIKTEVMKNIRFEDEMWFEKLGYAAFEDRGMFYKLLLNGYKTCVVSDAKYIHNDAKASTSQLKLEPIFCAAFNHYVFWHRFLYSQCNSTIKKLWYKICINYYIFLSVIYSLSLCIIHKKSKQELKTVIKGFSEAKMFVKNEEYKNLKSVVVKNDK